MIGRSRRTRAVKKPSVEAGYSMNSWGHLWPVAEQNGEVHSHRAGPGVPTSDLVLQAEYDAMLLEYAGEAIPALAAAAGGDIFAPFFVGFLPFLLCKTVSAPTLASYSSPPIHVMPTTLCPSPRLMCNPAHRNRAAQWRRSPLLWEHSQSAFRVWVLPQHSLYLGCSRCC